MWLWNFLNVSLKESLLIPFAPWLEPRWSSWTMDSTLSNQDSKIGGECSWGLPQDNRSLHFVLVAQSCLTLCNLTDCSPPGSSVYGIVQARILEWVAIPLSRGPSPPRDRTHVPCIAGRFFTFWAIREAHLFFKGILTVIAPNSLIFSSSLNTVSHSVLPMHWKRLESVPQPPIKNFVKNISSGLRRLCR